MIHRMIGILTLNIDTYEEVEHDATAIIQAATKTGPESHNEGPNRSSVERNPLFDSRTS